MNAQLYFVPPGVFDRLLQAAKDLLEARSNQMVTALEWQALQQAVIECDPDAVGVADKDGESDA